MLICHFQYKVNQVDQNIRNIKYLNTIKQGRLRDIFQTQPLDKREYIFFPSVHEIFTKKMFYNRHD